MTAALTVSSKQSKQVLDITELVSEKLEIAEGLCTVFVQHTTAAITTADLDPGTDLDMLDAFEAMVPKLKYRHPHDPEHTPDHILAALIGPSVSIPVVKGQLQLGTWQRVVLFEFDGPRERRVTVTMTS